MSAIFDGSQTHCCAGLVFFLSSRTVTLVLYAQQACGKSPPMRILTRVCYYELGGMQVLLRQGAASDRVHPGSPSLVQPPTALNVDHKVYCMSVYLFSMCDGKG